MATIYNYYQLYIHTAIDMLEGTGYLKDSLDWDVNRGKFTLRLRNRDGSPLTVLVITFKKSKSSIVIVDTKTHMQTEFRIILDTDGKNLDYFHSFLDGFIFEIAYQNDVKNSST